MVIQFQPAQQLLPNVVKSSDVLIPWAVRDIDCAIGTFADVIYGLDTVQDALVLREIISDLRSRLAQLESKALERADALCGGNKES